MAARWNIRPRSRTPWRSREAATRLPLEALPPAICTDAGWVARRDLVDAEPECGRKPLWRRALGF